MVDTEALRARYRALTDQDLLEVLLAPAGDYEERAMEIARTEASARGLEVPPNVAAMASTLDDEELRESALFCEDCLAGTTDDKFPASGTTFLRGLGPAYHPCDVCGSVVRDHIVSFYGLRLRTLRRFRVKQHQASFDLVPRVLAARRMIETPPARTSSDPRVSEAPRRRTPEQRRERSRRRRRKKPG